MFVHLNEMKRRKFISALQEMIIGNTELERFTEELEKRSWWVLFHLLCEGRSYCFKETVQSCR